MVLVAGAPRIACSCPLGTSRRTGRTVRRRNRSNSTFWVNDIETAHAAVPRGNQAAAGFGCVVRDDADETVERYPLILLADAFNLCGLSPATAELAEDVSVEGGVESGLVAEADDFDDDPPCGGGEVDARAVSEFGGEPVLEEVVTGGRADKLGVADGVVRGDVCVVGHVRGQSLVYGGRNWSAVTPVGRAPRSLAASRMLRASSRTAAFGVTADGTEKTAFHTASAAATQSWWVPDFPGDEPRLCLVDAIVAGVREPLHRTCPRPSCVGGGWLFSA